MLLVAGADPNAPLSTGNTPIHFSVRMENLDFTRVLLAAGANPNTPGENSKPPIHEAILQPNPGHIGLLASAAADINVIWAGATPLMSTMEVAQWEAARILIDLGADISLKNRHGKTAMDLGCQIIQRLPVNDDNRKSVTSIVEALGRRHATLPCASDLVKFK